MIELTENIQCDNSDENVRVSCFSSSISIYEDNKVALSLSHKEMEQIINVFNNYLETQSFYNHKKEGGV